MPEMKFSGKPYAGKLHVRFDEEGWLSNPYSTALCAKLFKLNFNSEFNKFIKQNFSTFSSADFIVAVTSHIPERHQKYINFYGYYSNKSRGLRAKDGVPVIEENVSIMPDSPSDEQKR